MAITHRALSTDLYQLTMSAAYFENKCNHKSTFELFIRNMPENRSFLVAAGVQQCLEYLTTLKFLPDEIEYLKSLPAFKNISSEFFDYLKEFTFTGDVYAVEEGTVFFPNEPVIRITAPAIEAQIVETYLLSMFNFQTLIASKAARIKSVAKESQIVEFGTRRAHSPEAGLLAARAAFIGGCIGTSNTLAGMKYGIPVYGTMAHSWVMSFDSEEEAFNAYTNVFPDGNILLIDTYDTIEAAKKVARLPYKVSGVRLDSGNFELLSKEVRNILDNTDKTDVKILVSGDMNEYKIQKLLDLSSPIDIFGVGTELSTSKDAPAISGVYKLVEQEVNGKIYYKAKFSKDKTTYPAKKQVYRFVDNKGIFSRDIIALDGELDSESTCKLLKPAIFNGQLIDSFNLDINEAQKKCLQSIKNLPEAFKQLDNTANYIVNISNNLKNLTNEVKNSRFSYV